MIHHKIILLEHRKDFKSIYGLNLTVYLGVKVLVAATVASALELLENNKTAYIFVAADGYSVDVGVKIQRYISKRNLKNPCFIVGKTKAHPGDVTIFESQMELKQILQIIAKKLRITSKSMTKKKVPQKYPLPLHFILPGWECCRSIYIKKGSEYIRILKKGEIITGEVLEKLAANEITTIFIESHYRLKFVNSFTFQISSKLNDTSLSYADRLETTAQAYQMVMEQARRLGITESTMELANNCISSVKKIISLTPNLKTLMENFTTNQNNYLYRHSMLIAYVGAHILKKVHWGGREHQRAFAFAAFFHDVMLTRDELAQFRSDDSVYSSFLSSKEKKLILQHALLASKLIAEIKSIPAEVAIIIKQHHGSKSGKSLSSFSKGLSVLSIVFMFAEEWAELAIVARENEERVNKQALLSKLHKKYRIPEFKRTLPELSLDF
ncbi:MAG: hypothetical protein ISR65_17100 [Bacteriovoracaceae bacterium]|nr:hypothetical protein [Bacteriovoracaceae bacterium]